MFLFGQDDQCSPPEVPQNIIHHIFSQAKTKPSYEIETLDGVGHMIDLPNSPPVSVSNHMLFPRDQVNMGGSNINLHSAGQLTAWGKLLDFFQTVLC